MDEESVEGLDRPLLTSPHPMRTGGATEANASTPVRMNLAMSLPRLPASIDASRRLFDTALTALGVAAACRADIALMLTEASTNAVVHAAGATYQVTMAVDHRWCIIEVVDNGPGLQDAHPGHGATTSGSLDSVHDGGRGMLLIRALSDAAERIRTRPQGLAVHMRKQLVWDTGTAHPR